MFHIFHRNELIPPPPPAYFFSKHFPPPRPSRPLLLGLPPQFVRVTRKPFVEKNTC